MALAKALELGLAVAQALATVLALERGLALAPARGPALALALEQGLVLALARVLVLVAAMLQNPNNMLQWRCLHSCLCKPPGICCLETSSLRRRTLETNSHRTELLGQTL